MTRSCSARTPLSLRHPREGGDPRLQETRRKAGFLFVARRVRPGHCVVPAKAGIQRLQKPAEGRFPLPVTGGCEQRFAIAPSREANRILASAFTRPPCHDRPNAPMLDHPGYWLFLIDWLIRLAALVWIPARSPPAAARSWLLLVGFVPLLGLPL